MATVPLQAYLDLRAGVEALAAPRVVVTKTKLRALLAAHPVPPDAGEGDFADSDFDPTAFH